MPLSPPARVLPLTVSALPVPTFLLSNAALPRLRLTESPVITPRSEPPVRAAVVLPS